MTVEGQRYGRDPGHPGRTGRPVSVHGRGTARTRASAASSPGSRPRNWPRSSTTSSRTWTSRSSRPSPAWTRAQTLGVDLPPGPRERRGAEPLDERPEGQARPPDRHAVLPGGRRLRARGRGPAGPRRSRACRRGPAIRCPTTGRPASTRCGRTGSRRMPSRGQGGRRRNPMPEYRPVEIPIGPQHPALKEPESFIAHPGRRADPRGRRPPGLQPPRHREGLRGADLHPGRLPHRAHLRHLLALALHVPSSRRSRRSPAWSCRTRAVYIRTLVAELERVHSHLLWLGVAGHEVGFDTLLMYTWRDREVVMDLLAALTGNRVNYGMNTIGGVRRDISRRAEAADPQGRRRPGRADQVLHQVATQETTLIKRLSGVGMLSHDDAIRLGAVGPTGRASGVAARHPQGRPVRRLRRARLQGHHRRPQRRVRPDAGPRAAS